MTELEIILREIVRFSCNQAPGYQGYSHHKPRKPTPKLTGIQHTILWPTECFCFTKKWCSQMVGSIWGIKFSAKSASCIKTVCTKKPTFKTAKYKTTVKTRKAAKYDDNEKITVLAIFTWTLWSYQRRQTQLLSEHNFSTQTHMRRSCEGPGVRTLAKIVLQGSTMYWTPVKIWRKIINFCGNTHRKSGCRFSVKIYFV